jgi:acyl-CoA thioester hydrolase
VGFDPRALSREVRTWWHTEVPLSAEGPNGLVQPQRILEWMQEAAANASRLGGYPTERYKAMNAAWFIREVVLAVDAPIRYGEKISVETWISEVRRFRTLREYRITLGGATVARGQVDWAFLARDPDSGKVKPYRFDEAMIASFPSDSERTLARDEIPEWGEDPEGAPDLAADRRRVRPSEIDHNGHVNHVVYVTWLEDQARLRLGDADELAQLRVEYIADAKRGDEVVIAGWSKGDILRQRIDREERCIARAVVRRARIE